jgi:hypothetical protein
MKISKMFEKCVVNIDYSIVYIVIIDYSIVYIVIIDTNFILFVNKKKISTKVRLWSGLGRGLNHPTSSSSRFDPWST